MPKRKFQQNDNNLAIAYYRYSSHSQNESSIEQQRQEAHKYAEQHSLSIVKEYADAELSGRTEERPEYQLMLSEIDKIRPAVLILWKTDRLSRNKVHTVLAKAKIRDAGCAIHYVAEPTPSDTPESRLLEGISEEIAEYYSAQLQANVRRGMEFNARNGFFNGHRTLGYKVEEGKSRSKKVILDPETVPLVRRIFTEYAGGKGMQKICEDLNRQGFRTVFNRQFTINSIRGILKNKMYIGISKFGDVVTEGVIPRIVSDELFQRANVKLAENKRRASQSHVCDEGVSRYWLSGKLICGHCGAFMTGMSARSHTGATHYYYACANQRKRKCKKKAVRKDVIEQFVVNALLELLTDSEVVASLAVDLTAQIKSGQNDASVQLKAMQKALKETEKQIGRLVDAIRAGAISDTIVNTINDLETRKASISEEIAAEEARLRCVKTVTAETIQKFFEKFKDIRKLDDTTVRDYLFEHFIKKIVLYDDKIVIVSDTGERSIDIELEQIEEIVDSSYDGMGSTTSSSGPYKKRAPSGALFLYA